MSRQSVRSSRWRGWAPLLLLAAAAMATAWWCARGARADKKTPPPAKPPVANPATKPAKAPAEKPAKPATAPAKAPKAATKPAKPWSPPRFKARQPERDRMVRLIKLYGMKDPTVAKAMTSVPRHEFVPAGLSSLAYADRPLPIGYGQTISQPYIVAEMTRQLRIKPTSRVLEIGTGSGYQAAVLTELTPHVYTIEVVKQLADAATRRLKRLGYSVVDARHGDGYYGWPGKIHFDAVIVTCAAGQVPGPLIKQLAPGGRMIIPVGAPFATQSLMLVWKDKKGVVRSRSLMAVRFVPFVRKGKAAR